MQKRRDPLVSGMVAAAVGAIGFAALLLFTVIRSHLTGGTPRCRAWGCDSALGEIGFLAFLTIAMAVVFGKNLIAIRKRRKIK